MSPYIFVIFGDRLHSRDNLRQDPPSVPTDPHDLARFVEAQARNYDDALAELRAGRKRSHWMWYVFPQIAGLGRSPMAQRYAIASLAEAEAYLGHPVLGPRLVACADALLGVDGRTAHEIMGSPDDVKLRSSATLFAHVAPAGSVFHRILDRYFAGAADAETERLLGRGANSGA
jgi:uncharacterized protein (DUF1810 family)